MNRGRFFRVDPRQWKRACALGDRPAIAYLIMARGTGLDHERSNWSINAIANHGGMRSEAARQAIEQLREDSLVVRLPSSRTRPVYEVCTCPEGDFDNGDRYIWLPNEFIGGAGDEVPPLKRAVQSSAFAQLKLIVSLYGAHELRECGGLDTALLHREHATQELGPVGRYKVWAYDQEASRYRFNENHSYMGLLPDGLSDVASVLSAIHWAEQAGLGAWELALFAGDPEVAEFMHPMTEEIAEEANIAVGALNRFGEEWKIPITRHITPGVASVFRFHYRPATRATGEWHAQREEMIARWCDHYSEIFSSVLNGKMTTG